MTLSSDIMGKVANCEGVTAAWCDVHGYCSCKFDDWDSRRDNEFSDDRMGDFRWYIDPECSLHGDESDHPRDAYDTPVIKPGMSSLVASRRSEGGPRGLA